MGKVEGNPEKLKFLIWVDYMQDKNQASLKLRRPGADQELSPWEEELLPVLERVEVKDGETVAPQTLPHLSVEYEFTTVTFQEERKERKEKKEKAQKKEKKTNEENLKPATNYEVRAR